METINHKPVPSWGFLTDKRERWAYWDNAFSNEECDRIIQTCKLYNLKQAETFGMNQNREYRDSDITWIQPEQEFEWVYQRLTDVTMNINSQYFGFDLWGFTESLQFTRYQEPAGKYDEHIDCVYGGTVRKLSIVVQLSDPETYIGGDFEYIDGKYPEKLIRTRGTLLAFPSFALHRVTPVTKGTRYSLVGWVSGKPFI